MPGVFLGMMKKTVPRMGRPLGFSASFQLDDFGNCVSCTHNLDSSINFDFYWGNVSSGEHSKDLNEPEAKINTL